MKLVWKQGWRISLSGLVLIGLSACADFDIVQKRVTTFGDAVAVTADSAKLSLQTVNQVDKEYQILSQARQYADGSDAIRLQTSPFLAPEHIKARRVVLDGLSAYGDALAGLSGGAPIEKAEKSLIGLGDELSKLVEAGQPVFKGIDDVVVSAAQKGLVLVGKLVVEHKLRRDLPTVVNAGHDSLTHIVRLIQADMATTESYLKRLQRQHRIDMDSMFRRAAASGGVTAWDMNEMVNAYYLRDSRFEAEIAMMRATTTALDKMLSAHEDLRQSVDPEFIPVDVSIRAFQDAANDIKEIYEILRK